MVNGKKISLRMVESKNSRCKMEKYIENCKKM